jgi:hypothetical protein
VLLFLRASARLRPETPDLTIRLVLQDRVFTATTRRTLSDTALAEVPCADSLTIKGKARCSMRASVMLGRAMTVTGPDRRQGSHPPGGRIPRCHAARVTPFEVRLDACSALILDGLSYRRAGRMVGPRPRPAIASICCSGKLAPLGSANPMAARSTCRPYAHRSRADDGRGDKRIVSM